METTSRYIDPLTDFGFKHLFGNEPNKEILIEFLNALFQGEKIITDLEYRSNEFAGKLQEEKKVFFDLYCTTDKNESLLVGGGSDWNTQMPEAYLVSIMNFVFDDNHSNYIQNVKLVDTARNEVFYKGMGYKFLILPNFVKEVTDSSPDIDKWFYLLKNLSRLERIPHFLDKRVFSLIFKIAEMSELTKEQRELYDSDLKAKSDYYGTIRYAAQEAAAEAKMLEKVEIARKLKSTDLTVEKIAEITNLSIEELEKLA